MLRHACAMGLEGIVSKKLTSRYKSGACRWWLKVKNPAYPELAGPQKGRVAQRIEHLPSRLRAAAPSMHKKTDSLAGRLGIRHRVGTRDLGTSSTMLLR